MANFLNVATQLRSSNIEVTQTYQQALIDLGALRIQVEDNERSWMPAAGMPWFVAVFGRDAVVTSLQTMAVSYEFGRGTLIKLAQLQATQVDGGTMLNPAKFCTNCGVASWRNYMKFPTPYYGQWMLPSSGLLPYQRLIAGMLTPICSTTRAPLERTWIDKYGDFDGDGFGNISAVPKPACTIKDGRILEIQSFTRTVVVETANRVCEVQGYVYNAWQRAAVYMNSGVKVNRSKLRSKASALIQSALLDGG